NPVVERLGKVENREQNEKKQRNDERELDQRLAGLICAEACSRKEVHGTGETEGVGNALKHGVDVRADGTQRHDANDRDERQDQLSAAPALRRPHHCSATSFSGEPETNATNRLIVPSVTPQTSSSMRLSLDACPLSER